MTHSGLRTSLLLACLVGITGCGTQKTSTTAGTGASPTAAGFKVALLTTGPVSDGGWNQAAYEGLQRVGKELGAQTDKQENLKPAQFREAFRDFASRGYSVIFAHGDEFGPDAAAVAAQFPNVVFITTGGSEKPGPNIAPIHFSTEQGTYLQGIEAALVSKTGKGGFVGGEEVPPVKVAAEAFANGAKSVNPKYTFQTTYINSWSDTVAAKSQADALISSGVDTLAHNCDAAAQGLFDTVRAHPTVYAFGVNYDENGKAPNVLSSAYLDIPRAFADIARSVKDHTFQGKAMTLDMKGGYVRLIDNPKLANVIPAAGKAKVEQAQKDIISGKIIVPSS
ncbi:MAG: BMP family protein [Armatimonadota bacterium]|nr:BMP family protein [Armatimonadota bacterium]